MAIDGYSVEDAFLDDAEDALWVAADHLRKAYGALCAMQPADTPTGRVCVATREVTRNLIDQVTVLATAFWPVRREEGTAEP